MHQYRIKQQEQQARGVPNNQTLSVHQPKTQSLSEGLTVQISKENIRKGVGDLITVTFPSE